ncbi:MAG: energy transducer TonB, partial [Hyphomicrobiaceae bacterium]
RSLRIAIEQWQRKVVVHLNKYKRYPPEARAARKEGDVTINFTMDRYGRIVANAIRSSSGEASLDRAALAMLERAGPLPAPPREMADDTFELTLPVEYRVKR